jgi:hypothetical protein
LRNPENYYTRYGGIFQALFFRICAACKNGSAEVFRRAA